MSNRFHRVPACLAGAAAFVLAAIAPAAALEDKLVIVTSFSKDLTGPYQKAFQQKYPGTKVEVLNKQTNAGIKYLQETASNNQSDIFWASAPDAFEVLKNEKLLQTYRPKAAGIAEKIGAFPVHNPDGFYSGFAASGYGIMYNTRYMAAKKLPVPKEWADLEKPVYFDHVAISAPSRSGTTHLTIETILQGEGWDKGWATVKAMAGNFAQVTERSFGVPDGVNSGTFGIGIVIDFFGFSSAASGFPVEFVYPTVTTLVPANVGVIKNAPHPQAAAAFVEFLLSPEGQEVLFDKGIMRLPVLPAAYAKAPPGIPNPFKDTSIGAAVKFDTVLSERRYNLVNSLFDQTITYRLNDLKAATKAIYEAEAALAKKPNPAAKAMIAEARALIAAMPIKEAEANDPKTAGAFKTMKKGEKPAERQAQIEERWDASAKANYAKAKDLAEKARKML
ncbi:MAG: extracellular solute-binding protein [Rhodospirillales bacterium]|nr:extracellular solute-binding protein [Rhodospirillales bacterium]